MNDILFGVVIGIFIAGIMVGIQYIRANLKGGY